MTSTGIAGTTVITRHNHVTSPLQPHHLMSEFLIPITAVNLGLPVILRVSLINEVFLKM